MLEVALLHHCRLRERCISFNSIRHDVSDKSQEKCFESRLDVAFGGGCPERTAIPSSRKQRFGMGLLGWEVFICR